MLYRATVCYLLNITENCNRCVTLRCVDIKSKNKYEWNSYAFHSHRKKMVNRFNLIGSHFIRIRKKIDKQLLLCMKWANFHSHLCYNGDYFQLQLYALFHWIYQIIHFDLILIYVKWLLFLWKLQSTFLELPNLRMEMELVWRNHHSQASFESHKNRNSNIWLIRYTEYSSWMRIFVWYEANEFEAIHYIQPIMRRSDYVISR